MSCVSTQTIPEDLTSQGRAQIPHSFWSGEFVTFIPDVRVGHAIDFRVISRYWTGNQTFQADHRSVSSYRLTQRYRPRANNVKDGWRRQGRNLRSDQAKSPASKFVLRCFNLFCWRKIFSLRRHYDSIKEENTILELYPYFICKI